MLGEEDAKMTRAPSGTGITNPVDLAYEYGEYTRNRDKANERGIYLCIWPLESDGTWKIALDLQKSARTKKPQHASVIPSVVEEPLTLVF